MMPIWFAKNSQSVGGTPLIRLDRVVDGARATVLAWIEGGNPVNLASHEVTSGSAIWSATGGAIDILVAAIGTGDTITSVSRYIKRTQGKAIHSVAVETGAHKIQDIGTGFHPSLIDSIEQVANEEAVDYARRLAVENDILAGISGGAAVAAASRLASRPENAGKTIIVVLPEAPPGSLAKSQEQDNWFLSMMGGSIACW